LLAKGALPHSTSYASAPTLQLSNCRGSRQQATARVVGAGHMRPIGDKCMAMGCPGRGSRQQAGQWVQGTCSALGVRNTVGAEHKKHHIANNHGQWVAQAGAAGRTVGTGACN
jgi:hypothetical protein